MIKTWWSKLKHGPRISQMGIVSRSGAHTIVRPHPLFGLFEFTAYLGLLPAFFIVAPVFILQALNIAAALAIPRGSLLSAKITVYAIDSLALFGFIYALSVNGYSHGIMYLAACFTVLLVSGVISIKHQQKTRSVL
jgi:hypothetical protein